MIGWKVDIGITNAVPNTLNNISQIEFLDHDVILTSGTSANSLFDTITSNTVDNREEIVKSIIDSIGNDYYKICAFTTNWSNNAQRQELVSMFPSFTNFFPNYYSYMDSLSSPASPPRTVIYFKNFNLLYTCTSSGASFHSVSNQGDISNLSVVADRYTWYNFSGVLYYPIILNYIDSNNFELVDVYVNTYNSSDSSKRLRGTIFTVDKESARWKTFSTIFSYGKWDIDDSSDNPYEPGGPSDSGGGGGSFDNDSDEIVDSSLPTISSANTGFTRIYNPSLSQVQALARYLWTDDSVIQTIWNHIKQYFEDPMQAIIGFNLVPVPVPNGGTQSFALMYIDTGVQMTVAASQFVDVDCGTFELKEYYGSALDYAPNTKISCFLPFIGTVSLNTDEVMGRTLQVKYRVDICSGSCVAKIAVDGNFIYQYSGHCAINIPISSADFSSYVSSAISVAQLAAGAIAAGAGGVMASGAVDASQQTNQVVTTTQVTNTARNPSTGRQITTGTMTRVETRESPIDQSSTQASFSGLTPQNISNTVGQIMASKPNINHSGSFSGNSGYLGVRRPFLIIERPNMCMPSNFQSLNGFPSMITLELSSCKGFTRVQQVQLTGLTATNPEQAEILQLLKSGVVL